MHTYIQKHIPPVNSKSKKKITQIYIKTATKHEPVVKLRGNAKFSAGVFVRRFSPATSTVSSCNPMHVPQIGK